MGTSIDNTHKGIDLDELCENCGYRYGAHNGNHCPVVGREFAHSGLYRTTKGVDYQKEKKPMYRFKQGTVLQDLINTRPCLKEFSRFMGKAGISTVDPRIHLDNEASNEAANSNPEWQDYGLKHGLLEEVEQPLSFKVEVDGEVVWEGEGAKLVIAENDWWVLGLTKEGCRRLNSVRGPLRGTNVANNGDKILEHD